MYNRHFRLIARAAVAVAAFAGMAGIATPASADTSVPVFWIESHGDGVAARDKLTIDDIVIGYGGPARTLELTLTYDVVDFGGRPFHFLAGGGDAACAPVGSTPSYSLVCRYTRQAQDGNNLFPFSVAQPISRPVNHGTGSPPRVKLTVDIGGLTMFWEIKAVKPKPEGDLEVKMDGPISGRVGDVVDVRWSLTNNGLDPIPSHDAYIVLTAPPGTEWTGPAKDKCGTALIPGKQYRCRFSGQLQPGATLNETWQLTIIAAERGSGEIAATLYNATNIKPDDEFVDPTPANNIAAFSVDIQPAAPGAPGTLPLTGVGLLSTAGVGLLTVTAGAGLVLLTRRRRARS